MKVLICLVLFIAAAKAGVLAPFSTYSAVAPAYTTYAAAAAPAYRTYAAAVPSSYAAYSVAPAYTSYAAAPFKTSAYTTYTADIPAYTNSVYSTAPVAYAAPVATYASLLKK